MRDKLARGRWHVIARRMLWTRATSVWLLSAATTFLLVTAAGCDTGAVGVDECREIETARCEAADACGLIDDLEACKRFYRDHCLHGFPGDDAPSQVKVDRCVGTLKAVETCRRSGTKQLADCKKPPTSTTTVANVCDIVREPELADECAFLIPGAAGAGGSGGDGGGGGSAGAAGSTSSGGSGGSAGSAGGSAGSGGSGS